MADYLIFGHGGRGAGTKTGTFVVPKNCNIHFFEKDGQLLNMAGATTLMQWLLCDHPYLDYVLQNEVVETFTAFQTVPNYEFDGDDAAAATCGVPATGVYKIGVPAASGPVITWGSGVTRRMSDFIGDRDNAFGNNFFWCCCRATLMDTNTDTDRITATTVSIENTTKARVQLQRDVGLTPSQVVARGGIWR